MSIIEIRTQEDLDNVRNDLSGSYILMNDIELREKDDVEPSKTKAGFEDKKGWIPIGDEDNNFTGIFDGNNHKITGLWIDRPDNDHVGLFGYIKNAEIKNLSIETANGKEVKGKDYVGGISGKLERSSIVNSCSLVNISGKEDVGGIAGSVEDNSIITNSYSMGNVSRGCYIGGIAGSVCESSVTNSYFVGITSGNDSVGGIAGYIENNSITNSTTITTPIKGFGNINRVVGQIKSSKEISNNFTRKTLTSGFTDFRDSNEYSGIGKDDSEFVSKETYEVGLGWKFGNDNANPWKIDTTKNYGLPYLYWQDVPTTKKKIFDKASRSISSGNKPTHTISFFDSNLNIINSITAPEGIVNIVDIACEFGIVHHLYTTNSDDNVLNNPAYESYNLTKDISFYTFPNVKEITTQEELDDIRKNLSGSYILMNDIKLDEIKAGFDADGWTPINGFAGIFDGNNHKITGLWIDRPDNDHVGLFGFIENAQIKNLGVEIADDRNIKGRNSVGGIAGTIYDNSKIINSHSDGNINGISNVGGIAGDSVASSISNSYSKGSIVGALGKVGGIAGSIECSSITNNYSKSKLVGNGYIGGIVGKIDGSFPSEVTNNAAINPSIDGSSDTTNRIVGYINGSTVSDNFALNSMSGTFTDSGNPNNHGINKTETELKTKSTYEIDLKWKFGNDSDNPWKINEGNSYPYLYWQDL